MSTEASLAKSSAWAFGRLGWPFGPCEGLADGTCWIRGHRRAPFSGPSHGYQGGV